MVFELYIVFVLELFYHRLLSLALAIVITIHNHVSCGQRKSAT